jgi:DNA-binding MarR family transcriptional regulator
MTAVETYRQRAATHAGLRGSESQAVFMINHAGSLSQIQLADQLGMTSGATTGLVDRLERSGIVERIRDRSDRRRNQVRLTDAGLQLVDDDRTRLGQVLVGVADDDLSVFVPVDHHG